jgi:hypothetical protein
MAVNMFSTAVIGLTLSLCIKGAHAQGSVVGSAQPGTMPDTFTVPFSEFDPSPSGCGTIFAGCTGELATKQHAVAGTVEVIDDCTFRIQGWQFDGKGPAVEWCGSSRVLDLTVALTQAPSWILHNIHPSPPFCTLLWEPGRRTRDLNDACAGKLFRDGAVVPLGRFLCFLAWETPHGRPMGVEGVPCNGVENHYTE